MEVRRKTTPLDNAAVNDYVKRVGANLAAQLPGGRTYRIETIREDPGGATHEPTALVGGFVFVSVDLIAAARNEAEFAGMLAHTMAHVAELHGTRLASGKELMQTGMQSAATSMPYSWVGSTMPLAMIPFQRAREREADHLAIKAIAAGGYNPAGLASYLERLQPPAPDTGRALETLPDRDQCVAAIHAAIRELPERTYESSDEFARVQAQVKVPVVVPTLIKK
jgi:predicted Zn-dependent protease